VVLIGPKTRPQLFPLIPGVDMAAVRLKLEWAAPILGIDPGSLDNQIAALSSVRMPTIDRLHESLMRTDSALGAIAILARTIRETRVSATAPSAAATTALEIMRRSGGRLPCDRVAGAIGISVRHLRRQVRDAAGLSPKAYARLLRLARAMQIADGADRPAWADVALRAGYCDQSHLIRECLALATASPQQLHQERGSQRIAVAERSNRP
jgi:AraC-like DNA-binding protein